MAIEGPETTGASPVRAEAERRMAVEDFLGFPRGMPDLAGRGRKSGTAIEEKPVEAQPVFGQISPLKRPDGSGHVGGKVQGDMAAGVSLGTAARIFRHTPRRFSPA
ncbi:MAG: hypothetical protein ABS76_19660 [Pelagibacterium sp. SCN 64-44]|nr:MAG: hypothetical protein ABS76_19660 [Pelagibacterium sp. SCN 64-44]